MIPTKVSVAYETIVKWIAENSTLSQSEVENVVDSGPRIAKAFGDMVLTREEILCELRKIFSVRFPCETTAPQLVQQSYIRTVSLCPHHLLPVEAVVHYGYVSTPGASVIGLSKFVRIAQTLAKRAVIQEQLTQDLADVMTHGTVGIESIVTEEVPYTNPSGSLFLSRDTDAPKTFTNTTINKYNIGEPVSNHVGVVINASHGCMSCRGVMSPSRTHTALFTGMMRDAEWKNDFYRGIEETRAQR